jgi:hypothetical protein
MDPATSTIVIADRLTGYDTLHLPALVGVYDDVGIDGPQRRTGDLGIDARLVSPLFLCRIDEHQPADKGANTIGE